MSMRLVCAALLLLTLSAPIQAAPAPIPSRPADADKWFRQGMDAYLGQSRPMDYVLALKLFRQAAAKGHPLAAGWAGRMLCGGRGADVDLDEGLKFIKQALPAVRQRALDGEAAAQGLLGIFLTNGWGIEKDEAAGFEWYRKAADQGDSAAMTNVGYAYNNGRGVQKDVKEAVKWYKKSAEKGNVVAMFNLGVTFSGTDDKASIDWYTRAAEKGHPSAAYNLGVKYEHGQGVQRQPGTALLWYRKGAALGHKGSKDAVARLEGDR